MIAVVIVNPLPVESVGSLKAAASLRLTIQFQAAGATAGATIARHAGRRRSSPAAGGWKSVATLLRCYVQGGAATMLAVVTHPLMREASAGGEKLPYKLPQPARAIR